MSTPRKTRRKLWLLLLPAVMLAVVLWAGRPWQRPIVIHLHINPKDGAAMVPRAWHP